MVYKYICPIEDGYKAFTIKWSAFIEIVPTRKGIRFTKLKGYVKGDHIILHYVPTVAGCIISTMLFPVGVILEGLANYKSTWDNMVIRMWHAEEKGSFSSDVVSERDNSDDIFERLIAAAKFK